MGMKGSFEDVSVTDVVQILGRSGRSGVLRIERGGRRADLNFAGGRIVAASVTPRVLYMTDPLVEKGTLSLATLHKALTIQRSQGDAARPIGAILLEMGAVTHAQLEDALRDYLSAILSEIVSWHDGTFMFEPGEPSCADELSFLPDIVIDRFSINPQDLLLEIARFNDENARASVTTERPAAEQEPAGQGQVILLSGDLFMRYTLQRMFRESPLQFYAAATISDLQYLWDNTRFSIPLLIVDMDGAPPAAGEGDPGIAMIEDLRSQRPDFPVITFGAAQRPEVIGRLIAAGVTFHLPRPAGEINESADAELFSTAVAGCAEREVARIAHERSIQTTWTTQLGQLYSLYGKIVALRRDTQSVTVSLEVLRFLSRYLDRAILFLVDDRCLVGLGVYGFTADRASAGGAITSLRIEMPAGSHFERAVENKNILRVPADEVDPVLAVLYGKYGAPARREAYLIPLMIAGKAMSIIYADNGAKQGDLCAAEPLGVLVEYACLLLENQLLRTRLRKESDDRPA